MCEEGVFYYTIYSEKNATKTCTRICLEISGKQNINATGKLTFTGKMVTSHCALCMFPVAMQTIYLNFIKKIHPLFLAKFCQETDNNTNDTCLTVLCPGLPVELVSWSLTSLFSTNMAISETILPAEAGTREVKPIWILLKQKTVGGSGSGISWAICKSAPCPRQIPKTAPHHPIFYRPFLPPNHQRQSTAESNGDIL